MLNIFAIKSFTIALFQNILKFREYSLLSKLENFHQHSVLTTIEQVFFYNYFLHGMFEYAMYV